MKRKEKMKEGGGRKTVMDESRQEKRKKQKWEIHIDKHMDWEKKTRGMNDDRMQRGQTEEGRLMVEEKMAV